MTYGFKEWAIVCQALLDGSQCVIVRKGGIAEGRGGFHFEHDGFYLVPTRFHEQVQRTRLESSTPLPPELPGKVQIDGYCQIVASGLINNIGSLEKLTPYHILSRETVQERFDYGKEAGVHIALVRTFHLTPAWLLDHDERFAGCRSWVELPAPPQQDLSPVSSEDKIAEIACKLGNLLS